MQIDLIYYLLKFFKILILLFAISSIIGFLRTFISQQKLKEYLIMKKGIDGHVTASILGALTPFSVKDSNKMFLNFLDSGVPFGIAFSFLITSPIINEYIAVLMVAFFGWKITLIYLISGILIGTITGFILSKFNFETHIKQKIKFERIEIEKKHKPKKRFFIGVNEGIDVLRKMWWLILLGMIGRIIIKVYLSGDLLEELVDYFGFFGVPMAIIIGIPFPGSGAAIIPITLSLFEKGLPLGTVFSFLMALVAFSIPKVLSFRKIMTKKLILIYLLILFVSVSIIGYLLNFLI